MSTKQPKKTAKIWLTHEQVAVLFTLQKTGKLPKTFNALAYRWAFYKVDDFLPRHNVETWIKDNDIELIQGGQNG